MTRIGIIGCGFWAQYQVAAWMELPVNVVAVCDPNKEKAKSMATKLRIPNYYTDAAEMMKSEELHLIDIITNPETHAELVMLAADQGIPVICQKPMSTDWASAVTMVDYCRSRQIPFYIHENFRWQAAMLRVKQLLDSGSLGTVFKARIYSNTIFPVIKNQPNLATLPEMIIADLGVHLLDLVRFFFGEARLVFCRTQKIGEGFVGENIANTFIETTSNVHCYVELSWASIVEYDCFPQTLIYIEGIKGSLRLDKDYQLTIIQPGYQHTETITIPDYSWLHPEYRAAQAALVACHQDIIEAIQGKKESANRAEENIKTLKLVYAAYESAQSGQAVYI